MNLYNDLPTPPSIRFCYWHPHYEVSTFCLSTKMTEQENRAFFALEDLRALEKYEKNKAQGAGGDKALQGSLADKPEALAIDGQTLRLKTAKKEKYSYLLDQKFLPEMDKTQFGLCNTQTNGGVPPKTLINRRDFLAR